MARTRKSPQHGAPISFEDTAVAFKDKSDAELLFAHLLFWMMSKPRLVKVCSQAAKLALAWGLPVKRLIKATIFRQFCGGENRAEYSVKIERLAKAQIGTILDYAVEGSTSEADFDATANQLITLIAEAAANPHIPCTCLKMTAIGAQTLFEKVTIGKSLSAAETAAWQAIQERLEKICRASRNAAKPIYIDAEESWIQGAVDDLVESAMSRYNRERAIVFTTLQLYRHDRIGYLRQLIARAHQGSYRLGVKIVRGAYMEKERERARHLGYPSPINDNKSETDHHYNQAIQIILDQIDTVELCAGTHNEQSCRLLTRLMAEKELPTSHPHIYFAQLFGMSDHISYRLGQAGYNVTKYLPFGPVEDTLPYLLRRAEENTAIAGQMGQELQMIITERKRRKTTGTVALEGRLGLWGEN